MAYPDPGLYPSPLLYPGEELSVSDESEDRSGLDIYLLAQLPFREGQAALEGTATGAAMRGSCGWYGPSISDLRGAVAVVRTGGPMADLVGDRLAISFVNDPSLTRSVYVYVHDEAQIVEDIALPRSMFVRLANLALSSIVVTTRVVT